MEPESTRPERVRRRPVVPFVFAFVLAASATSAVGQSIYTCTANGRAYSGDRPPPECAFSDIRELNRDGSLRRVIPRPLTAEEKRVRALEEKERTEAEERALAQRRRDRALLETYGSEEEIEAARAKALASSQDIVQRSEVRLEQMDAERKRLKEETDFYKNREVPHQLKRALNGNAEARAAELKLLRDVQSEVQRVNERFDADRTRFRELMQQGAQPARRTS